MSPQHARTHLLPRIPVPADAARILLFGGVFDPPHLAHTTLADQARSLALGDAWLVFVPAWQSPLKQPRPLASDDDRVEMLRLAIREIERSAIWTDEIDRARQNARAAPSYWIETLGRAHAALPAATKLRFLIGADQVAQFHRWHSYREILDLAAPLVVLRSPIESPAQLADALRQSGVWTEPEVQTWRNWIVQTPLADPSASSVRELLMSGNLAAASPLLHPDVFRYIRERNLYRTPPDPPLPSTA